MGACLATREAASGMTVGTHGTTFGGNPLAMAVGNAVLDVVLDAGISSIARRGRPGLGSSSGWPNCRTAFPASSPKSAAKA